MRRPRPADGEKERGGGLKGKIRETNAFDFWSSYVLRVLVDVGGGFLAVARFLRKGRLVAGNSEGDEQSTKILFFFSAQKIYAWEMHAGVGRTEARTNKHVRNARPSPYTEGNTSCIHPNGVSDLPCHR